MTIRAQLSDRLACRLPNRAQIWKVFNAILFPVFFWALLFFFRELPSYLLRTPVWDILGILAYILVIALMDSLILLTVLILIGFFIPPGVLIVTFPTWATLMAYTAVLAALLIHLKDIFQENVPLLADIRWISLLTVLLIAVIFGLSVWNKSAIRMEAVVNQFHERIGLLSSLFLILGVIAVGIVLVRNMGFQ